MHYLLSLIFEEKSLCQNLLCAHSSTKFTVCLVDGLLLLCMYSRLQYLTLFWNLTVFLYLRQRSFHWKGNKKRRLRNPEKPYVLKEVCGLVVDSPFAKTVFTKIKTIYRHGILNLTGAQEPIQESIPQPMQCMEPSGRRRFFKTFLEPRNQFQGIDSASYVGWRAGTTTLFSYSAPRPHKLF
jgi:hypothetical protein